MQLKTQPDQSIVPSLDEVSAHGLSFAKAQSKNKPKFVEFTCSHTEVETLRTRSKYLLTTFVIDFCAIGIPLRETYDEARHSEGHVGL